VFEGIRLSFEMREFHRSIRNRVDVLLSTWKILNRSQMGTFWIVSKLGENIRGSKYSPG